MPYVGYKYSTIVSEVRKIGRRYGDKLGLLRYVMDTLANDPHLDVAKESIKWSQFYSYAPKSINMYYYLEDEDAWIEISDSITIYKGENLCRVEGDEAGITSAWYKSCFLMRDVLEKTLSRLDEILYGNMRKLYFLLYAALLVEEDPGRQYAVSRVMGTLEEAFYNCFGEPLYLDRGELEEANKLATVIKGEIADLGSSAMHVSSFLSSKYVSSSRISDLFNIELGGCSVEIKYDIPWDVTVRVSRRNNQKAYLKIYDIRDYVLIIYSVNPGEVAEIAGLLKQVMDYIVDNLKRRIILFYFDSTQ